ncbi:hypothetical protein KW801_01785 [Candidatus Saccharibacteria bacterium]|nr:hypothetical protein [Candidatus Saccharibacteria bacterium]
MQEKLSATSLDLLELDVDTRLADLILNASRLNEITPPTAENLILSSFHQGQEDARSEPFPEKLYTNHGYDPPNAGNTLMPLAWLNPEYRPTDDEIVNHLERTWERKLSEINYDFVFVSKHMRSSYALAHSATYLAQRNTF